MALYVCMSVCMFTLCDPYISIHCTGHSQGHRLRCYNDVVVSTVLSL